MGDLVAYYRVSAKRPRAGGLGLEAQREAVGRHGKFTHSDSCTGALIAFERTQGKGSFEVMTDRAVGRLDADIILPASSVKPEYKGKPALLKWPTGFARAFRGPVVLGIRDISRSLEFRASYTLVEHVPGVGGSS